MTVHEMPPRGKKAVAPKVKRRSTPKGGAMQREADWEAIERDYCDAKFSLRELAELYGPSPATIMRRAKAGNWQKDLGEAVLAATNEAVLQAAVAERRKRSDVRKEVTAKLLSFGSSPGDAEKIAAAAELGANVILQHRQDTGQSRMLAMTMMAELSVATHHPDELAQAVNAVLNAEFGDESNDEKAIAQQVLRSRLTHLLDLGERAKTLDKVVSAIQKLHTMERVAHGIDKPESEKDKRAVATRSMSDVERAHRLNYLINKGLAKLPAPPGESAA